MIILKSPASSVIFNDGEFFTGHGAIKMQTQISDYEGPKRCVAGQKARRVATTRRGKLAADLLQVQRPVTIYSRLGSKSQKGMAVGKRPRRHHIQCKSCCHCDERSEQAISTRRARADGACIAS